MRLRRRRRNEALVQDRGNGFSKSLDVDALLRVAPRKLSLEGRIVEAEGMLAQGFGIVEEVIDNEEGRIHRTQLGGSAPKNHGWSATDIAKRPKAPLSAST